jgi:hypothetical protein
MKTMTVLDVVAGGAGEVYATINNKRYNFAHVIDLEATAKKKKTTIPILGRRNGGNKTTGLEYTGKATFHYNTSIMRELVYEYKETGKDTYFEIQVTNEDDTTSLGRQTVVLQGVNLDSSVIAKIDVKSDDYLTEEIDFTYEDFEMPEKFNLLSALQ